MRRIFKAYRDLIGILFGESPFVVIATFFSALLTGLIIPASVWVNGRIFDLGLLVAGGKMAQDGAHDELMSLGGEYARLYTEQAKWYNR